MSILYWKAMANKFNLALITSPVKLIAFPVSHYCEKVRWALELLEIPYIEKRHLPTFHWKYTEPLGGKSVPLLIVDDRVLTDSAEILIYLHENFDINRKTKKRNRTPRENRSRSPNIKELLLNFITFTWYLSLTKFYNLYL